MALLQMNYFSQALMRQVHLSVMLPVDHFDGEHNAYCAPPTFRSLYLLHGIMGDDSDWINGTRVGQWAMEHNIALIMPSGENHFYVDRADSPEKYGTMIGKELVTMTRAMFPLSRRREDTMVAGLSMGGYGAIKCGLDYSDTFGIVGAFSSALILNVISKSAPGQKTLLFNRDYYRTVFGDRLEDLQGSDYDVEALLNKPRKQTPTFFMTCGLEDTLLASNRHFVEALKLAGVPYIYRESHGAHTWDFWDSSVADFFAWLEHRDQ